MKNNQIIYVICPDNSKPSGGVKQLFRLVDVLNLAGYEAYIIHGRNNVKINWFENKTPARYFPDFFKLLYPKKRKKFSTKIILFLKQTFNTYRLPERESIIVFPEIFGPNINNILPENRIVIFNQNCYYSFNRFKALENVNSAYENPKTLGCIVVSDDSFNYLKYSFPNLNLSRIRLGIGENFAYSHTKKKQIAFMPRKLPEDSTQIIQIVSKKVALNDWVFVSIDDMPEIQVANILKESVIFLSFNDKEGFGLPPAEAMACGCYVIGYVGGGGKEYFNNDYCSPIEHGAIIEYAKEIEYIVKEFNINPTVILKKGLLASNYITNKYNMDNEREDTYKAWAALNI